MPTILIAEDDPLQRRTLRRMLESGLGAKVIEAEDGAEALVLLKSDEGASVQLALVDLSMPVMGGLNLLKLAKPHRPDLPFLILTASEQLDNAVEAMRLGAVDFINKPAEKTRLLASVRNALAITTLQQEVDRLQSARGESYGLDEMLRVSPGLAELTKLAKKGAGSEIPILITGESGVGKELLAHGIHRESKRADAPFVSVNCGALPENLVESTLFGHEKGAFTGATSKAVGKCREADGGVLFLDEVGELKADAQVKLLRMLQEGEIEPVGSARPVKVDVRVISATNRSLEQMVAAGHFREDLYYRLHGLPLHVPPLRERGDDVLNLAKHLLQRIGLREQRPLVILSPEAKEWLRGYDWPGNVRELQHMLSRSVLLAESNSITAEELARWAKKRSTDAAAESAIVPREVKLQHANGVFRTLEEIEQEVIDAALLAHGGHVGRAAAALGIGQSTLYKRGRRSSSA